MDLHGHAKLRIVKSDAPEPVAFRRLGKLPRVEAARIAHGYIQTVFSKKEIKRFKDLLDIPPGKLCSIRCPVGMGREEILQALEMGRFTVPLEAQQFVHIFIKD